MIERIDTATRMSKIVKHNDVAYLCGQVGDGVTVTEQTQDCLARVDALLQSCDAARYGSLDAAGELGPQARQTLDDLIAARDEHEADDVAIVRVEQFYPFPAISLVKELERFKEAEMVWCQEEPMNQGAWYSSQHHMRRVMNAHKPDVYLGFAGREASAAPAAGYMALHLAQQEQFINEALGDMPWLRPESIAAVARAAGRRLADGGELVAGGATRELGEHGLPEQLDRASARPVLGIAAVAVSSIDRRAELVETVP